MFREGSCRSLSEKATASERSDGLVGTRPVQEAEETLQVLGNLSSANRDHSLTGKG